MHDAVFYMDTFASILLILNVKKFRERRLPVLKYGAHTEYLFRYGYIDMDTERYIRSTYILLSLGKDLLRTEYQNPNRIPT